MQEQDPSLLRPNDRPLWKRPVLLALAVLGVIVVAYVVYVVVTQ